MLKAVAEGSLDILESQNYSELEAVQRCVPVLAAFIVVCPKDSRGQLHEDVRKVIGHIVCCALRPFDRPVPSACSYPLPDSAASVFSYFPHLPQRHGPGRYKADQQRQANAGDDCRKRSYGHPTLTPGIFTIFCPHGICYGFDVLRSCESPRHPFEIFTTRFEKPPSVIVYDNACHLHS